MEEDSSLSPAKCIGGSAVLRRSEPSSRTTLTGEQPDAWDLLQPRAVMHIIPDYSGCRLYHLLLDLIIKELAYNGSLILDYPVPSI